MSGRAHAGLAALLLAMAAAAADVAMPPQPWPEWGNGTVELAANGQPRAIVVVAENPTRAAQIAAAEFIAYVRKITGVELPLVVDAAAPRYTWSPRRVLVGESRMTLAYGLRNADFAPQEYLVATRGQDLVLMGRDAEEYGLVSYEKNGLWPTAGRGEAPIYTHLGSLYAVDTFLERVCGVRWYLPGEVGEVCPPRDRLLVGGLNLRLQPWTRHRSSSRLNQRLAEAFYNPFDPRPPKPVPARDMVLWMLRLKIGGAPYHAGHAFNSYFQRFGKDHPDWWKEGEPTHAWPHPDYVNPDLMAQAAADARAAFANGARYFAVTPNDGRKGLIWSAAGEALRRQDPADLPESFSCGWASDFVFSMANAVARQTPAQPPDHWIACAAYAPYFLPPSPEVGLAPGIAVCHCGSLHDSFRPDVYQYHADNLTAWSKLTPELYVWEWYLQQAQSDFRAFPAIFPRQVARAVAHMREVGIRGMFFEASAAPAVTGKFSDNVLANPVEDLLNHYVTWKLLVDPEADVDRLLAEHYRLFYGPAAAPMQRFHERLEARWQDPAVWTTPVVDKYQRYWRLMYTPELGAALAADLAQARDLAADEPYRTRVDLADRAILQLTQERARQYELQFLPRARVVAGTGPGPLSATVTDDAVTLEYGGPDALGPEDNVLFVVDPGRLRETVQVVPADAVDRAAPWRATVRLPLAEPWLPGEVWGVNAVVDSGGTLSAWAPVAATADNPDELGVLTLDPPGEICLDFEADTVTSRRVMGGGRPWDDTNVVAGHAGNGLRLLGAEAKQYLQVDVPEALNIRTDDFTVACWARSTTPGGVLFGSTTTSPFWQFYQRGDAGDMRLCGTLNAAGGQVTSVVVSRPVPELTDGQWHHYAMAVDRGRRLRLYVDGRLVAHMAIAHQHGALKQVVTVGGPYNHYAGDLDDVRIVQGALDENELCALMTTTTERTQP